MTSIIFFRDHHHQLPLCHSSTLQSEKSAGTMLHKQQISNQTGMAVLLKAMAHPERLAILKLMSTVDEERLTVKFIYENLRMPQPVASRHLNILKYAGVIKREQEGQKIYYSLRLDKDTISTLFKRLS